MSEGKGGEVTVFEPLRNVFNFECLEERACDLIAIDVEDAFVSNDSKLDELISFTGISRS